VEVDLLGLIIEDQLEDDMEEYHHDKVTLKRTVRSPFDEDIDEKEDSDEDEGEDEIIANPPPDKKNVTLGLVTTTAKTTLKVSTSLPLTSTEKPSTAAPSTVDPQITTKSTREATTQAPTVGSSSTRNYELEDELDFVRKREKAKRTRTPPPNKGILELPEDYNNLVIPKEKVTHEVLRRTKTYYLKLPVFVFLNIRSVRDIDESMDVSLEIVASIFK